jgi:hypothetical protein
MRQLLPTPVDPVDPMAVYGDLPTAAGRPAVRLNMIASVDGATTLAGVSGGLGGRADHALFAVLRSLADVVLVAAGTVWAERYGPSARPRDVVSRSLRLDWDARFFTAPVARPNPQRAAGPGRPARRTLPDIVALAGQRRRQADPGRPAALRRRRPATLLGLRAGRVPVSPLSPATRRAAGLTCARVV